jgi:hypothetical protein
MENIKTKAENVEAFSAMEEEITAKLSSLKRWSEAKPWQRKAAKVIIDRLIKIFAIGSCGDWWDAIRQYGEIGKFMAGRTSAESEAESEPDLRKETAFCPQCEGCQYFEKHGIFYHCVYGAPCHITPSEKLCKDCAHLGTSKGGEALCYLAGKDACGKPIRPTVCDSFEEAQHAMA